MQSEICDLKLSSSSIFCVKGEFIRRTPSAQRSQQLQTLRLPKRATKTCGRISSEWLDGLDSDDDEVITCVHASVAQCGIKHEIMICLLKYTLAIRSLSTKISTCVYCIRSQLFACHPTSSNDIRLSCISYLPTFSSQRHIIRAQSDTQTHKHTLTLPPI